MTVDKSRVVEEKKTERKQKKPDKGKLIKGMTRKLLSGILANPVFEKGLQNIMKGYSGIYALYRGKRLYYIGLTTNLHGRIKWHLKDRHARKWDGFVIFRIKRVDYLKDIETLITRLVDPPGNKIRGNVPRDADLNRVLREILSEYERGAKAIKIVLR